MPSTTEQAEVISETFGPAFSWDMACIIAEKVRDSGLVIRASASSRSPNPALTVLRNGSIVGAIVVVGGESGYLAAISGAVSDSSLRPTVLLAVEWIADHSSDIRFCWSDTTKNYARVLVVSGPSDGIYRVGFPSPGKTTAPPPYHPAHEDRFRVWSDR